MLQALPNARIDMPFGVIYKNCNPPMAVKESEEYDGEE